MLVYYAHFLVDDQLLVGLLSSSWLNSTGFLWWYCFYLEDLELDYWTIFWKVEKAAVSIGFWGKKGSLRCSKGAKMICWTRAEDLHSLSALVHFMVLEKLDFISAEVG